MYRNLDGAGFEDVTYAGGFGHIQKGHAVVFADLDHDGDQDVFEQMGGACHFAPPWHDWSHVLTKFLTMEALAKLLADSGTSVRVWVQTGHSGPGHRDRGTDS